MNILQLRLDDFGLVVMARAAWHGVLSEKGGK